ncbi:MAG: phosphatidate cytidylyltransferase [Caldimonas sp.]
MLKQRIITAAILLALLIPALIVPASWPFALLTLAAIAAAGWEWARLNAAGRAAIPLGALLGAACVAAFVAGWSGAAPAITWWLALAAWVIGGVVVLRVGPSGWPRLPAAFRIVLGLAALWTGWLALANAKAQGLDFILSVFALVWAADICAYFGGRAFGRRKLAPSISPGKSWEGVWSGMAGALVVAAVWVAVESRLGVGSTSLFSTVANRYTMAGMAAAVVFLVAMSVVGDLFESLVKRSAGAKDSSTLLPGHGGILDRIDALLPVFPIALALVASSR